MHGAVPPFQRMHLLRGQFYLIMRIFDKPTAGKNGNGEHGLSVRYGRIFVCQRASLLSHDIKYLVCEKVIIRNHAKEWFVGESLSGTTRKNGL